jgi:hypothetical protein
MLHLDLDLGMDLRNLRMYLYPHNQLLQPYLLDLALDLEHQNLDQALPAALPLPLLPLFLPLLMVVDRLLLAQGKPLMGLDLDMGKLLSLLHLPMLLLPMLLLLMGPQLPLNQ